jgi:toxin ParE1/3/4
VKHLIQTDQALADLANIWAYVAQDDPEAATRLLRKIDSRVRLLANYPLLGELDQRFGPDCRRIVVGSYLVIYKADLEAVRVLRVYHGSRRIEDLLSRERD